MAWLVLCAEHFHVFIGDLSQDVESHQLREAFTPFGEISYVIICVHYNNVL